MAQDVVEVRPQGALHRGVELLVKNLGELLELAVVLDRGELLNSDRGEA